MFFMAPPTSVTALALETKLPDQLAGQDCVRYCCSRRVAGSPAGNVRTLMLAPALTGVRRGLISLSSGEDLQSHMTTTANSTAVQYNQRLARTHNGEPLKK